MVLTVLVGKVIGISAVSLQGMYANIFKYLRYCKLLKREAMKSWCRRESGLKPVLF